ncbi:MAG TPA: hypothetical protein VHU13_02905 [Solirubrobacteraceae bacterium]|jgi:hypothetical protein|nr:hypothetical protein [Solirubrobacteraceae bacterium]
MPRAAEVREWWADVEDVRERIERRRARERRERHPASGAGISTLGRGVREISPGRRLMLVSNERASSTRPARRRPRPLPIERIGPHPDRIAAWAVVMGVALVLAALLSAH